MAIIKVLDVDFKGAGLTAPKLMKVDKIESAGSLYLIDFANGWAGSVVPQNTELVPNLLWAKAATILGSGDATSLSGIYAKGATLVGDTSSKHKVEFSGKKGLHVILSQSPGLVSGDSINIHMPTVLRDYVLNNTAVSPSVAHKFYVSMWYKVTRAAGNGTSAISSFAENTNNYVYLFNTGSSLTDSGVNTTDVTYKRLVNPNIAGANSFRNIAVDQFTGVKTNMAAKDFASWWGAYSAWGSSMFTISPSYVLYKFYVEDLTVSGRSYADVDALDYALWQEAFAVGGRFYGDTNTDPVTIP